MSTSIPSLNGGAAPVVAPVVLRRSGRSRQNGQISGT
jgi:hypothetical protein